MSEKDREISVAILTVSDSCAAGHAVDMSGPAISYWIEANPRLKGKVIEMGLVPDDQKLIEETLLNVCDNLGANLVLTTGGTGFAKRDVTPEATKAILEKEAPGMVTAIIQGSLKITPMAMLSRLACGVRGSTLIINLPGSKKAALECLEIVVPALPHAIDLLNENAKSVQRQHQAIQQPQIEQSIIEITHLSKRTLCLHSQQAATDSDTTVHTDTTAQTDPNAHTDPTKVARRIRRSPYPAVPVEEALDLVLAAAFLLEEEQVSYLDALGQVLAEDVYAVDPLPPFPASIKDGYAVIASDGAGVRQVVGGLTAGSKPQKTVLQPGYCARINTGAPLMAGADAVVQVEDTKLISEADEGRSEVEVEILVAPSPGQDIRSVGSDIAKGEKVLSHGTKLGASELGILATVGAIKVNVFRVPRVAVLSTGNELVEPDEALPPGKIRDSNKVTLMALLKEHGFYSLDLGIAEDRPESLVSKLHQGLLEADVVVSTGGVSMGDMDLLKPVLQQHFSTTLQFGRVWMKPGLPTTFLTAMYQNRRKLIFGLPGNPVSAVVTCNLFVIPALRKMSGHKEHMQTVIGVELADAIDLDPRPEFQRTHLQREPGDSIFTATTLGSQISSRLLSMSSANGLLVLPARTEAKPQLHQGEEVDCIIIGRI